MDSIYKDMTDAEIQVADYLKELDLWWVYQFPVFVYDEKKRPRVWGPDFYIHACMHHCYPKNPIHYGCLFESVCPKKYDDVDPSRIGLVTYRSQRFG